MRTHSFFLTTLAKTIELITGICFLSVGITFGIISGLGQTTSTGTSTALAEALNIKIGTSMFIIYASFLIGQIILLGKAFQRIRILQLVPIILQMFILNYFKYDFKPLQMLHPTGYFQQTIVLTCGICLISLGFTIVKYSYFLNYPPEAFFGIVAERLHVKFGTVKIAGDMFYIAAACLICIISGNKIDMIREGTLIFALCNGMLINLFTPIVRKVISFIESIIFKGVTVKLLLNGIYQYQLIEGDPHL